MKFLILLSFFAVIYAREIRPNCLIIRNRSYEKEVLKVDIKSPYQLSIDYDTNTLFFSYTARKEEMFQIAYLSLKTNEYGVVSGIHGGFATAVDAKHSIVYMGGEDGIYKFHYQNKTATNLNIRNNVNIWQMFFKDGLYFTTYPEETAFLYKKKKVDVVPEFVNIKTMLIAVNKDGNMVYANSSGLFVYNKLRMTTSLLDTAVVNGITADIDGNLYFSTPTGVYYINEVTNEVDELFKMENIYGVAVEGNGDIIYATEDSIIRLKPTKEECYYDQKWLSNESI
ncbi:ommochrome-binding protein-like isoform X2 [Trichoplusia ni]|nr:ommochrome-binding protein-like isoform X2 [Trichoplusia ni]